MRAMEETSATDCMSSHSTVRLPRARPAKISLGNFILPAVRQRRATFDFEKASVCAIVPTYKPGELTANLVEDLLQWNARARVYVVDDCTPEGYEDGARILGRIGALSEKVTMLRTPVNTLKAGALNYALERIFADEHYAPDVIVTLDDDTVILPSTIRNLVTELMSSENLGAVCSQCHVLNKNKNLLTRLQGLEYLGFNATRLADEGFFMGPLVMHGMLTAFRASALREVGGFSEGHLIEDYEVTARLKLHGWSVGSAVDSHAWTLVPESFSKLWRQRARWTYGGITVINKVRHLPVVIQDVIGHGVFWLTVCMIDILIVSLLLDWHSYVSPQIPGFIVAASLLQLAIWQGFQLWLMRLYKERDAYDWIIRISVLPEFIYSNALTLVLIGSYFFHFFNILTSDVTERSSMAARQVARFFAGVFRMGGYTRSWGTRT